MAVKIYNVINRGIRIRENEVFTAPELIADAGVFFEEAGGYYAGGNILVDGKEYALFVAPKELGEIRSVKWKTTLTDTNGANSTYNGKANMDAIISEGLSLHPAAEYCANLNINGFNDWHLPSPDELEIFMRYLKPTTQQNDYTNETLHNNNINGYNPNSNPLGSGYNQTDPSQTSVNEFKQGGNQALDGWYFSSMQSGTDSERCWAQLSTNLNQFSSLSKNYTGNARAVRWVEV